MPGLTDILLQYIYLIDCYIMTSIFKLVGNLFLELSTYTVEELCYIEIRGSKKGGKSKVSRKKIKCETLF